MSGAVCGAPRGGPRRQIRGSGRATPDGAWSDPTRSAGRTIPRTADSHRIGGAAAGGAPAGYRTRPHAHAAPVAAACAVRAAGSAPAGGVRRLRVPPHAGAWAAAAARESRRRVRCRDLRRRHGSGGGVAPWNAWSACARREAARMPLRLPLLPLRRALRRPDAGGVAVRIVRMSAGAAGHPRPLPAGPSGPGAPTWWRVCGGRVRKVSL